jgi:hypothetical protein
VRVKILTPQEFERQIAKIHTLLEGQAAKVEWNARFPDPDNPLQPRQVDILIERDGQRTMVECRHRSSPQDVTWVEELYGRRASLRASSAIAVSSSGFTQGAQLKAKVLGIILRDFASLTPEEIRAWGKCTRVYLEYIQFGRSEVNIIVPATIVPSLISQDTTFRTGSGGQWPIEGVLKGLADQLRGTQQRQGVARPQVFPKDLYVGGRHIDELIVQAEYHLLQVALLLPVVQVYGHLADDSPVYIERVGTSDFEVVRAPEGAFMIVDLSVVEPIKHAFFQAIVFDMGESVTVRGVGFVGEPRPSIDLLAVTVQVIRRDSGHYLVLMREEGGGPLIVLP